MIEQNILMVDDRPENLVALDALLDSPDRNLIKAYSGNEALMLMLKHSFALILLDVQMPRMDGFEVAELMRSNKKIQKIPIIFVTAISKEDKYVFKGYECGAVDYLFKPIEPLVLRSKVDFFLDLDRSKRELEAKLEASRRSEREFVEMLKQTDIGNMEALKNMTSV
ncbi:MAG: two-component system response regulator [Moraxellaceae bacterium]|nr:MAG: two-component system response regulator [Moraxellaceae bacterium]